MIGCAKCDGKGYIQVNSVEVESCECVKRQNLITRFRASNMPRKMANLTLDDWNNRQSVDGSDLSPSQIKSKEKAHVILSELHGNNKFPFYPIKLSGSSYTSVIFSGPKNSGKSFALCILAKKAIIQGASVKYYDWSDLAVSLDRFDNRQELDEIIDNFENCDLVAIDSIEKIDLNTQGKNQLTRIFRKRINNGLWTVASLCDSSASDIKFAGWDDFYNDSLIVTLP